MSNWILTTDFLPKKGGQRLYLCWSLEYGYRLLQFRKSRLENSIGRFITSFPPTHWKELPEAPHE